MQGANGFSRVIFRSFSQIQTGKSSQKDMQPQKMNLNKAIKLNGPKTHCKCKALMQFTNRAKSSRKRTVMKKGHYDHHMDILPGLLDRPPSWPAMD
jgi:hypothetical protein